MYMTRMELDRSRRATILALASPNKLHGAIESSFSGERQRRLWRIDELNGKCYLLVVSEAKPDFSAAAAQFAPTPDCWETREYGTFLQRITVGSHWHFRLSANPTISHSREGEKRGKVYAHVTAEQQKNWLMQRAAKSGFRLKEDYEVVKRDTLTFYKGADRKRVTLGVCEYEGWLEVTDADLMRAALTNGIGRGKAYGLGLLTIAQRI
ncbi:MAG: type I-E CRISPR-associated protein Cas6/Cse3/CasE [Clostridia bacterium]|nr:type I-E CRISPR-associated protein Cas6/Cse3/CasE [Clostridia bacterium]MBQ6347335.1 type I-E CRISPR-associated protein Cas6/Cse3/CasE [Clostridia bacterium]